MRLLFLVLAFLGLVSCNEQTNKDTSIADLSKSTQDTVIIKHKKILSESYEVGFLSKSYRYYWLVGKDTLDFQLNATEHEKDSSLQLHVIHDEPILFSAALRRIDDCLRLIKDDFYISRLSSFYFKPPLFYVDMAKGLSNQYEQKFGRKNISFQKLNQFLLGTDMNSQINTFLGPLNKRVSRYGIEKFHILSKEQYRFEMPGTDLSGYPDFTIHGMGLSIQLASDK